MESFIFTIIIWLLIIPVLLIDNLVVVKILVAIQIILLIAQIIYVFLEFKNYGRRWNRNVYKKR